MQTMADIRNANARAGQFFFEPASMRFFRCRLGSSVYPDSKGGAYFTTSEQFVGSDGRAAPRLYTVRYCAADGRIDKVGRFQAYLTARAARRDAAILARS